VSIKPKNAPEKFKVNISIFQTHPIAVENGDLFSSADNFGLVVALVEVLQDCVAVPWTTF
jgi:hypothetical protein